MAKFAFQELVTHRKIMKDEYGAAMNWYRAAMQNINLEEEQTAKLDPKVAAPVLMIVANNDPLSNEIAINAMHPYIANLKVVRIDSGHWIQIEKKEEVNVILEDFFKSVG